MHACFRHFLHCCGNCFRSDAAAGSLVEDDLEACATQLQDGVLYAVVGCQAAADYGGYAVAAQIFDGTGGEGVLQIVVAGTVGVFVRFDALENLEVVGSGVETCDEVEALGADDGVRWPADIKIGMSGDGSERSVILVADPERVGAVRIAGRKTEAGIFCLRVQLVSNEVAFCYGQFVRADRGEGVLGINIKRGNVLFFR